MLAAATAGGVQALRPRLLARRARTEPVTLRRIEGPRRGAGTRLGPRLGDRPPAGGLRARRPGNARAVQHGQARADADAAQGPRVGDPRRRSRPPAPRACRARRALEHPDRARRRQARRLDPPRVRARARRRGRHRPPIVSSPGILLRLAARADQLFAARRPSSPSTARPISPTATGSSSPSAPPGGALAPEDRDRTGAQQDTAGWYRAQAWL